MLPVLPDWAVMFLVMLGVAMVAVIIITLVAVVINRKRNDNDG